jgi:S-adenosylmethionine-diacylgycerolhomoserine-N-methlytransferase
MIPVWRECVENALKSLRSGGDLFIVDFYDQADLPKPFQKLLKAWLRKFHVQFWDDLMPHLAALEKSGVGKLEIVPLFKRYSFIARLKKNA